MSLLEVNSLGVTYQGRQAAVLAARDVSFSLEPGELVGLVGESGSGKSTIGQAITGTMPPAAAATGSVRFGGVQMIGLDPGALRRSRREGIALMPQNGLNALNPVLTIEGHFWDVLRSHQRIRRAEARRQAAALLAKVGLEAGVLRRFPHELSGGMRQRVCLAIVLSLRPRLIVFDEPTTALDVLTQQQVLQTIGQLQSSEGFAGLLISHDLGMALERTSRVLIMYAGRIVEELPSDRVFDDARHPYTQALIGCYGDARADEVVLSGIPGSPPDLSLGVESSCLFAPRCARAQTRCDAERPDLRPAGSGHAACFFANEPDDTPAEAVHVG
ncbi:MAG TPA: ABC transporter ATP-binding protein [Trebonia sp.]|jgi:oligopeptide/dipeptide ABC transporter ATP-binding protein|nr:ABC transporter ATP-binding protein [Trebonia sp.]